jgi:hypothetical protein
VVAKKSAECVIAKKCTNCKTGSVRVAMPVRKQNATRFDNI